MAEEAAKRLLLDLNLERKAKRAGRVGVGVAERSALVQAGMWAKRSEARDIHELEPLACSGGNMHADCPRYARGRFGSPRPPTRLAHQRFEMQSL